MLAVACSFLLFLLLFFVVGAVAVVVAASISVRCLLLVGICRCSCLTVVVTAAACCRCYIVFAYLAEEAVERQVQRHGLALDIEIHAIFCFVCVAHFGLQSAQTRKKTKTNKAQREEEKGGTMGAGEGGGKIRTKDTKQCERSEQVRLKKHISGVLEQGLDSKQQIVLVFGCVYAW